MPIPAISDHDLLVRAASGDAEAFASLYDRYASSLYRHILFRSGRREVAEDVVSQAFLRTWEHLREGKSIRSVRAFLYRTAQNAFVDITRRKESKAISLDVMREEEGLEPAAELDVLLDVEAREEVGALRRALQTLPAHYRQILTMRYLDELSISEIAQATGKNPGAIYVSLHRGIRALRRAMVEAPPPFKDSL